MKTVFDVGAYDGRSTEEYLSDSIVHLFEPNPNREFDLKKGQILNRVAVGDIEGIVDFNVCGIEEYSSSVCLWNDELKKDWYNKSELIPKYSVKVPIIRLDNYIKYNSIKSIDYLHIDAQGLDMEVLLGLGEYISIVKAGVIEMPVNFNERLYKDQKYSKQDAYNFLVSKGFSIIKIENNDNFNNELNIYFTRQ